MNQIISSENHIRYMQQALKQAKKAYQKDEVPIGAVIISPEGKIVSRAYNRVETKKNPLEHAEIQTIIKACKKIGDWRLEGYWIYVTLEPCSLCINAILLSRLEGLVFGAKSPVFGYHLDNKGPLQLYRRETLKIIEGIGAEESLRLLKSFFKRKRKLESE